MPTMVQNVLYSLFRIVGIFVRVKFSLILTLDTIGKNLTAKIYPRVIIYLSHVEILSTIDYVSSSCSSCLSNNFIRDNY